MGGTTIIIAFSRTWMPCRSRPPFFLCSLQHRLHRHSFGAGKTSDFLFTVVNPTSRTHGFISKWRVDTLQRVRNEGVSKKPITAFTISSEGHLLAYASSDLVIGIADADNLRPLFQIKNAHGFSITCLAFNRDDRILVSGSVDSRCRVVDLPAKLEKESFSPFLAVFIALIIAVIGYLLSSGFYDFPSHG
ncbi:hypothetical protein BC936DRAFT_141387 [Jimgerdemannia flammicorona]|uniref:Uncharacterized protein n=1 Tax=Jimgerdemannia flammicorona TaxID=994334 RepID=A0A433DG52_9FUNG|nr:hypothetical protein BC936DRAFT_141387 [Jimgerdemannia flammicorona]